MTFNELFSSMKFSNVAEKDKFESTKYSIGERPDVLSLHKRICTEDLKAIIKELGWRKESRLALCV